MNVGTNISGEIMDALLANGLQPTCVEYDTFDEIRVCRDVSFLVINHFTSSPEDAIQQSEQIWAHIVSIRQYNGKAMAIPADLWRRHREMTLGRMLAHCGIFTRIFARNCEVRRIRKPEADAFMNACHSYGTAACRNRYGLFTLRDTAEISAGTLVAAAEFSNMRLIHEEKGDIRSYEWIRYASLPNFRVDGGMGKVLRKFIYDIRPGDVVSYADLEWSDGEVYRTLGFRRVGARPPVLFSIDPQTMRRIPLTGSRKAPADNQEILPSENESQTSGSENRRSGSCPTLYYRNFGSLRYRLLL